MIIHDGKTIPKLETYWDASDKDYIWFVWDDFLKGATITDSTWKLPNGWTSSLLVKDGSVSNDGITYSHGNAALLSTTNTEGSYTITNTLTLSDGRIFDRSVKVTVKQL